MFILQFLPSWLFWVIGLLGVGLFCVSLFASQVPVVKQYGLAAQIVSVFLIIFGIYFIGASENQAVWEAKVAELESEMKSLQLAQPMVNDVVKTEYVDRPIEVVTKHTETIIRKIPEIITLEIDKECPITLDIVNLHNEAIGIQND